MKYKEMELKLFNYIKSDKYMMLLILYYFYLKTRFDYILSINGFHVMYKNNVFLLFVKTYNQIVLCRYNVLFILL